LHPYGVAQRRTYRVAGWRGGVQRTASDSAAANGRPRQPDKAPLLGTIKQKLRNRNFLGADSLIPTGNVALESMRSSRTSVLQADARTLGPEKDFIGVRRASGWATVVTPDRQLEGPWPPCRWV